MCYVLDIEGLQDQQEETEAFRRGTRSNHLEMKDITVDSILDALSAVVDHHHLFRKVFRIFILLM